MHFVLLVNKVFFISFTSFLSIEIISSQFGIFQKEPKVVAVV